MDGTTSARLGERDWIHAAFRRLATSDVDDIRVEVLARDLGVTKGSFYWHFRNRQQLLERLLDHWMDRATLHIVRLMRASEQAGVERLYQLMALPAQTPPEKPGANIEIAIRSWARSDEMAAATVRRVDRIRYDSFVELMEGLGLTGEEARRRAAVAQAFMLGEALLKTEPDRDERLRNVRACAEMLAA